MHHLAVALVLASLSHPMSPHIPKCDAFFWAAHPNRIQKVCEQKYSKSNPLNGAHRRPDHKPIVETSTGNWSSSVWR